MWWSGDRWQVTSYTWQLTHNHIVFLLRIFWYLCYNPHTLRDSLSPLCMIVSWNLVPMRPASCLPLLVLPFVNSVDSGVMEEGRERLRLKASSFPHTWLLHVCSWRRVTGLVNHELQDRHVIYMLSNMSGDIEMIEVGRVKVCLFPDTRLSRVCEYPHLEQKK